MRQNVLLYVSGPSCCACQVLAGITSVVLEDAAH